MKFLYLDESGDLGFNFQEKKPSKFFTITILVVSGKGHNRDLIKAVKKTIKRKLLKKKLINHELKGSLTSLEVKKFFYDQVKELPIEIYSITINKKSFLNTSSLTQAKIYDKIALEIISRISFESDISQINFMVDRSKKKSEIIDFNTSINNAIGLKFGNRILIDIDHFSSHENLGIQACDLFCHGIYQGYESNKIEWREIFREKILCDEILKE